MSTKTKFLDSLKIFRNTRFSKPESDGNSLTFSTPAFMRRCFSFPYFTPPPAAGRTGFSRRKSFFGFEFSDTRFMFGRLATLLSWTSKQNLQHLPKTRFASSYDPHSNILVPLVEIFRTPAGYRAARNECTLENSEVFGPKGRSDGSAVCPF